MRMEPVALLLGRVLLGSFFLFSASSHFLSTPMLAQAAAGSGVPFPTLAVLGTGVLLLVGGLSLVLGVAPRIGIACLVVFLLGVTPMMHAFWALTDPQARMMQMGFFLRNVALLGAVVALLSIPTPWPYSLGAWWSHRRVARHARTA